MWITATAGVNWDYMTALDKLNLYIGVFCTWGLTMVAFFDKTIAKLDPSLTPLTDAIRTQLAKETTFLKNNFLRRYR